MAMSARFNIIKSLATWCIVLAVLLYIGWQAFLYISDHQQPRIPLTVGDGAFKVRVVNTPETRQKGLSGSQPLPASEGMLFVFDTTDNWAIWMKDMNYPIDIIWLDDSKRIVYMVKSADPSSYPYTTFKPSKPARYVLEVPAGTITNKNIKINNQASFDLSSIKEGAV